MPVSEELSRAEKVVGDWIVYGEPVKLPQSEGFLAVAEVGNSGDTIPNPTTPLPAMAVWRSLQAGLAPVRWDGGGRVPS